MMLTQHPSASMRREAPPHHMPSPRTAPFYPSTPQDSAPLPLHTTRQRPSTPPHHKTTPLYPPAPPHHKTAPLYPPTPPHHKTAPLYPPAPPHLCQALCWQPRTVGRGRLGSKRDKRQPGEVLKWWDSGRLPLHPQIPPLPAPAAPAVAAAGPGQQCVQLVSRLLQGLFLQASG